MKNSVVVFLLLFMSSFTSMANEIKLYTSASLSSGTYQIISYLVKEVNNEYQDHKIIVQTIPGAEGLNSFNRFQIETNSILLNQEDSFKTHNISLISYEKYDFINNPHSVIVSSTSNINSIGDLIILSKKRELFHGRISSGSSADISLNVFMKINNITNVKNIKSYKRADEIALALSNGELDFAIRSYASFNKNNLVKKLLELDVGSKWILIYRKDMVADVSRIDVICRSSKSFKEFMRKMDQNRLICLY